MTARRRARAARAARAARVTASSAIGAYQRWVSPHKGFACACRVHEGRASCSTFARRAIGIHGLWRGLGASRARLRRCGEVHRRVHGDRRPGSGLTLAPLAARRALHQRGDCDPGCGDCDLPAGSGSGRRSGCFNVLDCADCGCDGCGDDRRDRDVVAEWGPTILWVLTVLLAVALGVIVFGCTAGGCASLWPLPAWWACLGLTGLFAAAVLVLRIRREMPLLTTIATLPMLAALAGVAASGFQAWARWFGL